MYTFIEIELIFKRCQSCEEIECAREAFSKVIKDEGLPNKKIFFMRREARIRKLEIERFKK